MAFTGSKTHILEVVDAATERFGSKYRLNRTRYNVMDSLCDLLDEFVSCFEADYFDVNVDEDTTDLEISVVCDEFVFKGAVEAFFFTFVRMFDAVSFKKNPEDGKVAVSLVIHDMWSCSNE